MAGQSHGKLANSTIAAEGEAMSDFPFDVVAFDLDGTLADTAPDLAASLNHSLQALGRPEVAPDKVRGLIGHGVRALLKRGLATSGDAPEALVDRALPVFVDHYRANIANFTRVYPGLEPALGALSGAGVKLAVCTNKIESLTLPLLDALGLTRRFDAVVGGDTLEVRKPDPRPLHEAIARAGGGRAAYVGDSITDAETARAAGIPFLAVTFGYSDRPVEQLGALALIDDYSELEGALRSL
jgi:phosphoglycolate phosphatase